ncbi:Flp pilus assembly protein CpaB [Allorhizobium undicola]|uniref:Flp pilus assembly protein CpaB n=1 Tax=Allorhizobium undicola TaxID=78527 RepID=UPI000487665D|nr:Flp pilus assembly protein CpaB [Allorhizobium undicola]
MKPARVLVLVVAVAAAGLAGLLATSMRTPSQVVVQQSEPVVEKAPSVKVLVAGSSLPVGSRLNEKTVRWMEWPKSDLVQGLITEPDRPDAIKELDGAIVRMPIFEGEPLRLEKIADSSSRILSALLPSGKRAVSTEITVATGAGGFILPNDRVDVIMVRKGGNSSDIHQTDTILANIRVLAIDQQIEEKNDGTKTVLGTTATLELTPEQAKVLAAAQQVAERLSLALRSVADAQEQDTRAAEHLLSGEVGGAQVQVIKAGQIVKASGESKQ